MVIVLRAKQPTHNAHVKLSAEGRQRVASQLASDLLFIGRQRFPNQAIRIEVGDVPMAGFVPNE